MASVRSLSLSESIQASLILQRQEDRKRNPQQPNKRDVIQNSQWDGTTKEQEMTSPPPVKMPVGIQILLTAVFFGMEVTNTFSMMYDLLFLQFLDVPTSMMTFSGVITGLSSIVGVPVTGWLADRGSNLVNRKLLMMGICLITYIIGLSGMIICSALKLKLHQHPDTTSVIQDNATLIPSHGTYNLNDTALYDWFATTGNSGDFLSSHKGLAEHDNIGIQDLKEHTAWYISLIGLLSFGIIDIGFDMSNSLCRSYVLECCPPGSHKRILLSSISIGSVGGLTFAIIGTINFPGMLGPAFNVDGTAATVLLFSSGLLLITILSFICTMLAGKILHQKTLEQKKLELYNKKSSRLGPTGMRTAKQKLGTKRLWDLHEVMHTNSKLDRVNSSSRLLNEDQIDNRSYSAFSDFSQSIDKGDINIGDEVCELNSDKNKLQGDKFHGQENEKYNIKKIMSNCALNTDNESRNEIEDIEVTDKHDTYQKSAISTTTRTRSIGESECYKVEPNKETKSELSEIATSIEAIKASYSISLSLFQAVISHGKIDKKTKSTETNNDDIKATGDKKKRSIWRNKHLYIILLSTFFCVGSSYGFTMYCGNSLTIGVYGGVPTASPGTPGRARYEEGLRKVSFGYVLMYLTYAVGGFVNEKIFNVIGENGYFIVTHLMLMAVTLTFQLTKIEELYFTTAAVTGLFRICAFSLSYIMVHKLIKSECADSEDQSKPVDNLGQVMAAAGVMLPCNYLFLSASIGPLIGATGNVWVPVIMMVFSSALALLVFLLTFIVKP